MNATLLHRIPAHNHHRNSALLLHAPEPLPTYTILAEDGLLVFSGATSDVLSDETRFVIPTHAIEATVLTNYDWETGMWRTISTHEPGSTITLNGSRSDLLRIVFPWNGTIPNLTLRETEIYIANAPNAVRLKVTESPIATNIPQADPNTLVRSAPQHYNQRTLSIEGSGLAYLGITSAPRIELEQAPTRWHLIRPSEYVQLASWTALFLALLTIPAILAARLPKERFLFFGPLAFGTIGALYHIAIHLLNETGIWTRIFTTTPSVFAWPGALIGLGIGPLLVWRRFDGKHALISTVLSIPWAIGVMIVFAIIFVMYANIAAFLITYATI